MFSKAVEEHLASLHLVVVVVVMVVVNGLSWSGDSTQERLLDGVFQRVILGLFVSRHR